MESGCGPWLGQDGIWQESYLEPRCHSRAQRDLEDDLRHFFRELAPLHVHLGKYEDFVSWTNLPSTAKAKKVFCHVIETAVAMRHDDSAGIGALCIATG